MAQVSDVGLTARSYNWGLGMVRRIWCGRPEEDEVVQMMRTIRRMAVVLGAVTGLLALFGSAAVGKLAGNHCEPVRRV
jgi:hypothetical protein